MKAGMAKFRINISYRIPGTDFLLQTEHGPMALQMPNNFFGIYVHIYGFSYNHSLHFNYIELKNNNDKYFI